MLCMVHTPVLYLLCMRMECSMIFLEDFGFDQNLLKHSVQQRFGVQGLPHQNIVIYAHGGLIRLVV